MSELVLPNSGTAREVYRVLKILPLATAKDLAGVVGKSHQQAQGALTNLEDLKLVRQDRFGSFTPRGKRAGRWRLTERALEAEELLGETSHDEGNVCYLLFLLPMLSFFYHVLGQIKNLGNLVDFLWTDGLAMDAAATFERGWIALYWSGPQETENEIAGRMSAILDDVGGRSGRPAPAWPCCSVWVVADQWQRELFNRAASKEGSDSVSVWCVDDGSRSGVMEPNPRWGRGWLRQTIRQKGDGDWSWDKRVASSIWSQTNGYANYRMLRLAHNFAGMTPEMGRLDLREKPTGKAAERTLRDLARMDLLGSEKAARNVRYHLDKGGIETMVRLDKASHGDYRNRALSDSWVTRPDRRTHEEGELGLIADFMGSRLPVAPGWRCEVYMGNRSIEPDGAVLPNSSPYGAVWHLIEYERSARGMGRVAQKLRGHGAPGMRGRPVLVVCYNERAEANFHAVGEAMDLPMLTTTVERLNLYGPLDNFECWSMYGEPVRIW